MKKDIANIRINGMITMTNMDNKFLKEFVKDLCNTGSGNEIAEALIDIGCLLLRIRLSQKELDQYKKEIGKSSIKNKLKRA